MATRQEELVPEEADVLARVGDMPVDLAAMSVIANVWRAAQAARSRLEREVLREEDLTWSGFSALFILWVWGPLETRELAASMNCARATISGVSDTLEARGLIARAGDDRDRRLVRLALTDAGRARIESLFPRFNAGEARLVRNLSAEEQATLARLLRRVVLTAKEER